MHALLTLLLYRGCYFALDVAVSSLLLVRLFAGSFAGSLVGSFVRCLVGSFVR